MTLYRLLISVFAAIVLASAMWRGERSLLYARLGATRPRGPGPHLWLHGASNGELAAARPVVLALRAARPDLPLLVTANSETGVALVRGWGLAGVTAHPAPVDLFWVTRRVMRRWHVAAHVTLEAELWPHRILDCPGPVILLAARLRPRTARAWARLGGLCRRVLGRLALACAQDRGTRARLRALGMPRAAEGPLTDLKALYRPPERPVDDSLRQAFPRDATWLAASTHAGEDAVVLEAHAALRRTRPDTRLILAPRHPRRADAIAALAAERGLTCARRSRGDAPGAAAVYLADTMGEMALWYALAGRVFIGGTLTDRGGHTPYEPAAFGAALLHGPDVANFRAPFARLRAAGAARCVTDAESLCAALIALSPADSQRAAGQAAAQALRPDLEPEALVRRIAAHLPPPDIH